GTATRAEGPTRGHERGDVPFPHLAGTRARRLSVGRRLYETMLPWETDPSMRDNELWDVFADVWCAIPKVVFSRTLDGVEGMPGLPKGRRPRSGPSRRSTKRSRV